MKRYICSLFVTIFAIAFATAFDLPVFSGYTGLLTSVNNKTLEGQLLMSGQLDFSGRLLLRGGIYIQTESIEFDTSDKNAYFTLEEGSATYVFNLGNLTNYVSLFLGNYEPIGSDVFLQRQFGIKPISSQFTTSFNGLNGNTIYKMNGFGGAYTVHLNQNMALGAYIYKATNNNINYANTDLRFAGVFDKFTVDASVGLGFPIETTDDNNNKVIILIRTLTLHGGATVLIGNSYGNSVFIQAGIKTLIFDPNSTKSIGLSNDISNFYIFVEPRFVTPLVQLNMSFFVLPVSNMKDMLYLSIIPSKYSSASFSTGYDIAFMTNQIHLNNTEINVGTHFTTLIVDPYISKLISDFSTILNWKPDILITPCATMDINGVNISTSLQLDILGLQSGISSALKFNIGLKSQL